MQNSSKPGARTSLLLSLFILGLVAALTILAPKFRSEAVSQPGTGLFARTTSQEEGLEYYDVREDKNSYDLLDQFRQAAGRDAAATADIRDRMVTGESSLRERIPSLHVSYNHLKGNPELIEGDFINRRVVLEGASNAKRSEILRDFANDNRDLLGMRGEQINGLKVTADYKNPDGNLSFAMLEHFISGIPVFRSSIKAGFTVDGEMFRVINDLAPGLDDNSLSTEFGDPANAVRAAAANVKADVGHDP